MQSPEAHLLKLGIDLAGAVDPSARAVLEPSHRVVVNGQFYWTSSAEHTEAFRAAPYRYSGLVRDSATQQWFEPTASSPRRDIGDEIIYVISSTR